MPTYTSHMGGVPPINPWCHPLTAAQTQGVVEQNAEQHQMNGLRAVGGRTLLLKPTGVKHCVRYRGNKPQDFWKDIAEKYFPALPPLQHVPEKNTYIPKDEGEDRGSHRLPSIKYLILCSSVSIPSASLFRRTFVV